MPGNWHARFCSRGGGSDSLVYCNRDAHYVRAPQCAALGSLQEGTMGNSCMDIDRTGSGSEQSFSRASICALGKERWGNCSVGLNNMFSQLLRLDEREGQRPFPGESEKTQRRRA